MSRSTARRVCLALLASAAACSAPAAQIRASAPWDPDLAPFFDDAADFIANPGDLEGTWATDYAVELRGRVDAADLICRIHVNTVREDIAVEGARRKHLLATVTSAMHGVAPPDERLYLTVDEGSGGFDTIDRNVQRILDNRFVAFVRWYEDDEGALRAHWHLSPATPEVVGAVRAALEERESATPEPTKRD